MITTIASQETMRARMLHVWEAVKDAIAGGPVQVQVKRPSRSSEQNRKFHALIGDIAKTVEIDGRKYSTEVWKAMLVDGYENELKANGEKLRHGSEVIFSLDRQRVVTIRPSTTKFTVQEGIGFIEYLYCQGVLLGAKFSDPAMRYYEEISAS